MGKFKVEVGDYVDTAGMGEAGRSEVVFALIKAGCKIGEGYDHANIEWGLIGNGPKGIFYHDEIESFSELCGGKSRKITIEQLQGREGISQERPGEWDGTGIPPVGTVCEATWEEGCNHLKCVILSSDHMAYFDGDNWDISTIPGATFRPIQSEEQRQVAEIQDIIETTVSYEGAAQAIYNAGFRKVEQ